LAAAGVGNQNAIEFVAYGFDATVAWLLVALLLRGNPAWPVALWLAFESGLRGTCRVALPLNVPPPKDTTMCSAAFGMSVPAWGGLILAALCAAYVWRLRATTTD
jgi:hypothetical protein